MSLVALLTDMNRQSEGPWLDALRLAMPEETIRPLADIEADRLGHVEVAVVANPQPSELSRLPNLRWIHSLWAGVEKLVREIGPTGVPIVRLVDPELARAMAEAVLAWTYYLFRDMPAYARQQREGVWKPLPYRHPSNVTVGILGLGELGTAAGLKLREAGFATLGWSRTPKNVAGIESFAGEAGLAAMLSRSDILVCLLPLTPETNGLLDSARLGTLPAGASLINFGRGPILNEGDLLGLFDAGHLAHAVLDVFRTEPLPAGDPLWRHERVTVLPHVSGPTDRKTASRIVAANIRAFRATGAIPATVDIGRGY
ncbi:2-hydroxyacid dehydrogenase [Aureimonas psammosilenae]|uniref:2-hydroxyacid dehydrogenase n=1 Tax=Aureimonas psammosilenae TaxID=2495496 RepID=UPI001260FE2E|nr:glyoxylate/hydroxypyruvate reductase A [Aureimonas psammosilenae]